MSFLRIHDDPRAEALRLRILGCIRPGVSALDELLTALDFRPTTEVSTAAMVDDGRPTLLVNPDFVDAYCRTDERLFVLLLHEYLHVVLGHTRLFGTMTETKNLAFDAVINAMISQLLPEPAYLALLRDSNPWESFPGRLLRPPPGWPQHPKPLPADACDQERRVVARLYGERRDVDSVTYHEVFELLDDLLAKRQAEEPHLFARRRKFVLLGDHRGRGVGGHRDTVGAGDILGSPEVRAILDHTLGQDSPLLGVLRRVGDAGLLQKVELAGSSERSEQLEREIEEFFGRVGIGKRVSARHRPQDRVRRDTFDVRPSFSDRRAIARLAAGGPWPAMWRQPAEERRSRPQAFVYLDLSASMCSVLPKLLPALTEPIRQGAARLFGFSTCIHEVEPRTFGAHAAYSSGGTSLAAVLEHLLAMPVSERPSKVAVVTDGYVGQVDDDLRARWRSAGIEMHMALTTYGGERWLGWVVRSYMYLRGLCG